MEIGSVRALADGVTMAFSDQQVGRRALECLLGLGAIEDAADVAAHGQPGANVAESVLAVLRSDHASEYCYRRLREEDDPAVRRGYASVLRSCAAGIALAWLDRLWADEDETVQVLAAKMLEGMIQAGVADNEEMRRALEVGSQHQNSAVREQVEFARAELERQRGSPC